MMGLRIVQNPIDPLISVSVQDPLQKLLKCLPGRFGVLFDNHVTGRGSDRAHENSGRVAAAGGLNLLRLLA